VRSVTTSKDDTAKKTYRSILEALLGEPEQPRTRENAVIKLRDLVRACPAIDPRRYREK